MRQWSRDAAFAILNRGEAERADRTLNQLQDLGLISDEVVTIDEIAPVDEERVLALVASLKEAAHEEEVMQPAAPEQGSLFEMEAAPRTVGIPD